LSFVLFAMSNLLTSCMKNRFHRDPRRRQHHMALVEVASLCEDGSLRKRSIITNRDKLSAWSKLFTRKVNSGSPIRSIALSRIRRSELPASNSANLMLDEAHQDRQHRSRNEHQATCALLTFMDQTVHGCVCPQSALEKRSGT
jgi:hypothetical protein